MKETETEEFYIGYQPRLPARLKRRMRWVVGALSSLVLISALVAAAGFQRLPEAYFEFGREREFTGTIIENPYPALITPAPGVGEQNGALMNYLLSGRGKHAAVVSGFIGRSVKLRGTLVHRSEGAMIEVSPDSIELTGSASAGIDQPESLGRFTLKGEIVDSKCYLGVMNPGRAKVHRDCAVRCISGGIPPLFAARDSAGNEIALLLTSSGGEAVNQAVLDMVGEPVEITGNVFQQTGRLFLRADPQTYKRLN